MLPAERILPVPGQHLDVFEAGAEQAAHAFDQLQPLGIGFLEELALELEEKGYAEFEGAAV